MSVSCFAALLAVAPVVSAQSFRPPAPVLHSGEIDSTQRVFAPQTSVDGKYISFEATRGDSRLLYVAPLDPEGRTIRQIQVKKSLFVQPRSYHGELEWCPSKEHPEWFVFVSGESNNLDVFLGRMGNEAVIRLTESTATDYQPRWSADGTKVFFLSGRDRANGSDLYEVDNAGELMSGASSEPKLVRITDHEPGVLYPAVSPDGRWLALSAEFGEADVSYEVGVIDLSGSARPVKLSRLTEQPDYDLLAPSWSSDGKYIAFYSSKMSEESVRASKGGRERKEQAIGTLRVAETEDGIKAENVQPWQFPAVADPNEDSSLHGPVWVPGKWALVYVKDDPKAFNPVIYVEVEAPAKTAELRETKMNVDLSAHRTPAGALEVLYAAHFEQSSSLFRAEIAP